MPRPFIIGITGGSGSGFISQDDYYVPREEQYTDKQGKKNFDLPRSIDKKAFRKDIEKLIAGESIIKKEYVFNNELKTPRMLTFHSAPILIVEGLFVFHYKKIQRLLDLKIFLHAKENLKVIRRVKRDRIERNYPLDDVLYRYENHVLPSFEKYTYGDSSSIRIHSTTIGGIE